jgi:Tfp pilus assembly protein PilN
MAVSVSTLGIVLVTLIMILAYALFPFTIFSSTANPPNLYGYMSDHKENVANLEQDLSRSEARLSDLRGNFIPQAKAMIAEIGELKIKLEDFDEAYDNLFTYALWSDIIEEIDNLAPNEVDLTYIAQDDFQVVIEGITDEDSHIAEYAHNLIDSDLFRDDPPYNLDVEWSYELTEKGKAEMIQTPQMYDNWPGEAVLVTSGAPTPGVDYWAVIVGVADYPGIANDLQYTDDDANDIRDTLLASNNWEASHITMLIDEAATKSNIQDAIADMGNKTDADDVVFFFFSGHGTIIADTIPLDEADYLDEAICQYDFETLGEITDDELAVWLADMPANPVLVAIDTCYSGGMIKTGEMQDKALTRAGVPQEGDGFAKDLDDVIDGVILTACDDDEPSYENPLLQNGVFTYYFVEGLNGPADANSDDEISMEEAFNYLYWRVTGYTPPYSFIITVTLMPKGGG